MMVTGKRREIIIAGVLLLMILQLAWQVIKIIGGLTGERPQVSSPITATITALFHQPSATGSTEAAPGLIVYGKVQDQDGAGIENVTIYRSYASYEGKVISTTDGSGYYVSGFYGIPGDEMVSVWAVKSGMVFTPEYCHWRHYYGYELAKCDFTTQP